MMGVVLCVSGRPEAAEGAGRAGQNLDVHFGNGTIALSQASQRMCGVVVY